MDLITTRGRSAAAVERLAPNGQPEVAAVFLIELTGLNGRDRLPVPMSSLLAYHG